MEGRKPKETPARVKIIEPRTSLWKRVEFYMICLAWSPPAQDILKTAPLKLSLWVKG
jgi:hypothetical protein